MTPTPATYRTRRRRPARIILIVVAAAAILGLGTLGAAWQINTANTEDAAKVAQECITIQREHEVWNRNGGKLGTLTPTGPDNVRLLGSLKADGDSYYKAVTGYSDDPSKALAVAVAQYNHDLGLVAVEQQLSGKYSTDKHDKAVQSAFAVLTAYDTFHQQRCAK